jgi:peptide/nickel transport system substrate-binding protein
MRQVDGGGVMKNSRTKRSMVTSFLIISLMLAGSQFVFAGEPKPQYGGTLRVADSYEGASIGYPPKMTKTLFAMRQASPAVETLLRVNKAGQPVPWLATTFKEDAKTQTITLTLRTGIKFHDGTDFNAEAVKWNLDQHIIAKTAGTEKIKSVDVVNNSTIKITLSSWDSTFTGNLTWFIGLVISPTACKKNGEEWAAKNPVGTGPFQFTGWEKDVRTVYKKFPDYWQKGKPYLDGLEYGVISDNQTREFSLRNGEKDIGIRLAMKSLVGLEKDGFVITRIRGGSGAISLVPDSGNPNSPFVKVKVRQAVAHAIDNEAVVKAIFLGEAMSANQHIWKGNWAYDPSIKGYPYNPAKAKQLLTEAGYPSGFKTKLTYVISTEYDLVFAAVQGYLRAIGIEVELEPVQIGKYTQTVYQGGKWEGLVQAQPTGNPDVVVTMSTQYGGGKQFTLMSLPDDYTKALQDAVGARDAKSKAKAIQTAMKLMIDKYALTIPLYFMPDYVPANRKVHNHGMLATPQTGLWTPEDAWMER